MGTRHRGRAQALFGFGQCLSLVLLASCSEADKTSSGADERGALTPALTVTVNSVSTGRTYVTAPVAVGVTYYIDRNFRIASLSAGLGGGVLIKTANDDKNVAAVNYLRFTPNVASTVYVALDKRMTRLPGWVDSTWRLTSEVFTTTGDAPASPMKVYAKDFGAVRVQLGGNRQSPANGGASNFVVVVVAKPIPSGAGGAGGIAAGGSGVGGSGVGGSATGGANTGGANTGGANTGGANTGGANTGGANTGGANTGGANTGGANTGGANTGGANTGGANTGGANTGGANTGGAAGGPGASLYVVAHPDDDLLFMNPDLETDIQAGKTVLTVYSTSGDGGDPNVDWRGRESRVRAAHAAMAGVADSWSCAPATYAGKPTVKCTLAGRPQVKTVFLRLLDGYLNNLPIGGAVETIDSSTTFTGAQFTATLTAIQNEIQPTRVGTLDASFSNGPDHDDHVTSALFAYDVARADGVVRELVMYRGYSMYEPPFVGQPAPTPEPQNLTAAQYQEKLRIISVYQPGALDDPFDQWCRRMYPIVAVSGGAGPLRTAGGKCLQASGTTDGSGVLTATCTGSASQTWTVTDNSRILTPAGKCLAIAGDGSNISITTCGTAAGQRWTMLANSQLRGTGDGCLTLVGSSVFSDRCDADTSTAHFRPLVSQRWTR